MKMRILGLDPGLRRTGWGVVEIEGTALRHVANGAVTSNASAALSARLAELFEGVQQVIREWRPDAAAVEETFVNRNPASTLKLGQARGIALLAPALEGLDVAEYAPNRIKKAIVGTGHADKVQIRAMVSVLLPAVEFSCDDAADALALAICHSHYLSADRARAAGLMRAGARI